MVETTAKRNSSLQGAYLIVAARALGLDCGPMSGFDHAKVDEEFFAAGKPCFGCDQEFFPEGHVKANFLCNLGYGDPSRSRAISTSPSRGSERRDSTSSGLIGRAVPPPAVRVAMVREGRKASRFTHKCASTMLVNCQHHPNRCGIMGGRIKNRHNRTVAAGDHGPATALQQRLMSGDVTSPCLDGGGRRNPQALADILDHRHTGPPLRV
jgi:hypothetical protein